MVKRIKIRSIISNPELGATVNVKGWVRTKRGSKNVTFIAINDGSTIKNIQAVAESEGQFSETIKLVTTGACVSVTGKLAASQGAGQAVDLLVESLEVLGPANPDEYPLQPKKHSLEFLREIAHLRPRTATFSAG